MLYTGRHIQHTKMFDNTNFPWISSMSTEIPTIGHMLRAAGYYTAYKGKWHLTKEFETVNSLDKPETIFTDEMEAVSRASVSAAWIEPRLNVCAAAVRAGCSSVSNPGGKRSFRSSPRPLTLFSSQIQRWPACSPSARANPVIPEILIAALSRICRASVTGALSESVRSSREIDRAEAWPT